MLKARAYLAPILVPMTPSNNVLTSSSDRPAAFNWATFILEIVIIVVASLYASSVYADFDSSKRLGGLEAEYLTRTAYSVPTLLREKGRIPLWDPFMELGDPMLTNPVSFYFNPVLMGPELLLGPNNGVKVSIILSALVAGLGGWALGRVLGLGPLARLLLALLLIGKGNMHSFLSEGHYAFFASQAYFPWIFAGVIGILRGYRRWPLILTALGVALVFFCGSPWYPPALALSAGLLTLCYTISFRRGANGHRTLAIEWGKIARVLFAFVLALCLSAVTFITLWNSRQGIGGSLIFQDYRANLGVVLEQFFSGFKELDNPAKFPEGNAFAFYSFVAPAWFSLLLVLLFALVAALRRRLPPLPWRAVGAALVLFFFCMLWGAGQNPVIELLYVLIPLATQFRHVERVLALASVWLAVLVAIIVDMLWQQLVHHPAWQAAAAPKRSGRALRRLTAVGLIAISGLASIDVLSKWHVDWGNAFVRAEDKWEDYCVSWLRDQHPGEPLDIWTLSYRSVYTNYRNEVRHGFVGSDFYHAQPMPSTLFSGNLIPRDGAPAEVMPEYAFGPPHYDQSWMDQYGYTAIPESADPYDSEKAPCLYRRENAYSYAFTITRSELASYSDYLPPDALTPITSFVRDYDRIGVLVRGTDSGNLVVAVQELAFPGWTVTVDGQPTPIESIGGFIGVLLPPDESWHKVLFQYLPADFYIGAAVTLITALGMILYLLRIDRVLPEDWLRRFFRQLAEAWDFRGSDGT